MLVLTSLIAGSAVNAAVTAQLNYSTMNSAILGSATGNFNQTFTDPTTGADVTLNFAFTATGGGSSPVFNSQSSIRLGMDSTDNVGDFSNTSVNQGETIVLGVGFVSSTVSLASVDFNVESIAIYRSGPGSGEVNYSWSSSASTGYTLDYTASYAYLGDVTDDQTFDISSGVYTGTFSVAQSALL